MLQNVGTVDRIIRIVVGVIVAVIGIIYHSWWGLLALIPLLTAGVAVCPLYMPFGISTRKKAAGPTK
jgi:phage tail protein X